jgi:antitoxin component of RelBE/YafQ-DinJ toxin-antitoxin module
MYLVSSGVKFNDRDLEEKLIALEQDLPFEIDIGWKPVIIKQVRDLQKNIQNKDMKQDREKLESFVKDFKIYNFK